MIECNPVECGSLDSEGSGFYSTKTRLGHCVKSAVAIVGVDLEVQH